MLTLNICIKIAKLLHVSFYSVLFYLAPTYDIENVIFKMCSLKVQGINNLEVKYIIDLQ